MRNALMNEKELNVKAGDRVCVHGYIGTVTEVVRGRDVEWNGTEYVEVEGSDYTNVTVAFDNPSEIGYQYEGGQYGLFEVLPAEKPGDAPEKNFTVESEVVTQQGVTFTAAYECDAYEPGEKNGCSAIRLTGARNVSSKRDFKRAVLVAVEMMSHWASVVVCVRDNKTGAVVEKFEERR